MFGQRGYQSPPFPTPAVSENVATARKNLKPFPPVGFRVGRSERLRLRTIQF